MRIMFVLYGAVSFVVRRSTGDCRRRRSMQRPIRRAPLGPSRRIVVWLAALFSHRCLRRRTRRAVAAGAVAVPPLRPLADGGGNLLLLGGHAHALSQLAAPWVARRIGLINTMVFTHIPSSLALIAVAFALEYATCVRPAAPALRAVTDGRSDALRVRHVDGDARRKGRPRRASRQCRAAWPPH